MMYSIAMPVALDVYLSTTIHCMNINNEFSHRFSYVGPRMGSLVSRPNSPLTQKGRGLGTRRANGKTPVSLTVLCKISISNLLTMQTEYYSMFLSFFFQCFRILIPYSVPYSIEFGHPFHIPFHSAFHLFTVSLVL